MPFERATVWISFQELTAAALNGEFNTVGTFVDALETLLATVSTRSVVLKVIPDATALTTGDGKYNFVVPVEFNGMDLVTVGAHVFTVSSSGLPKVQIARDRSGSIVDMLNTGARITIDENEKDSSTAVDAAVINTANDDVLTGDVIRVDVDVAGTSTAGLEVRLGFRIP